MELRHLRYFVAVAEELHFRRAAERLHVAQPAVSEQIRKLERELGVRLLDRDQRRVALTHAGAVLLREARRVLDQADAARTAVQHARDHATSCLRVGYVPASLPAGVGRILQRLAVAMPHLETTLEPGSNLELIESVRAERLDAAIVSLPAPTAGLRTTALTAQGAVAAVPSSHAHAVRSGIRLRQMAPERIVVLPREANRPFYDAVLSSCQSAGLSPTLVEMPDANVERTLLAVASGAGMALLPDSVADRYLCAGVRFVPLDGEAPVVATAVVSRRDSAHMPTAALLRAVAQHGEQSTGAERSAPIAAVA
jgi:DNA-binding transcriptional LysR family regulator